MAEEYKYRFTIKTDEPITACNDCIHAFVCKKSMFKLHFAKCPDYEERRMNERKTYEIENEGCDDTTYSQMELTKEEAEVLFNMHSSYGCQPRIHIVCGGEQIV